MASTKTKTFNTVAVSIFHRKKQRRLFNEIIRKQTTSHFYTFIQEAISKLLLDFLRAPQDFLAHITMCVLFSHKFLRPSHLLYRFGASSLFASTYGSEATESAGFSLHAWEKLPEMLAAGTPGAYLVVSPHSLCLALS
jgi:hypothetical protein